MSKTIDLAREIESAVAARSLLQHPFYQAWSAGALTKEQLAGYAKEYYWAARHVPAVMAGIQKSTPRDLSKKLRDVIKHQSKEEREHVLLWERFARSLGISQRELRAYKPTKTVRDAVASLVSFGKLGFVQGVAAMHAFECELPAISKTKSEGLKKFYSLKSRDAQVYFKEHLKEERHLKLWRTFLASVAPTQRMKALATAKKTVAAQNRILDGVIERYCQGMA